MCGFAGVYTSRDQLNSYNILDNMISAVRHRGPDEKGIWLDSEK